MTDTKDSEQDSEVIQGRGPQRVLVNESEDDDD